MREDLARLEKLVVEQEEKVKQSNFFKWEDHNQLAGRARKRDEMKDLADHLTESIKHDENKGRDM